MALAPTRDKYYSYYAPSTQRPSPEFAVLAEELEKCRLVHRLHPAPRALVAAQYRLCGERLGDELRYVGTATVARDLDYMAALFDGPNAPM